MLIPLKVDVPQDRYPFVNWLIIAGIVVVFGFELALFQDSKARSSEQTSQYGENKQQADQQHADRPQRNIEQTEPSGIARFVLTGWGIRGFFGHMWLHADFFHLLGNLLFLWIFGNAVCAKIGNIAYLPIYLAVGLAAAASHLIFRGGAMVGASGAINGIVGMFLVFFPENSISCVFFLFFRPIMFNVSSYWIILLWVVFDIWGATRGGAGVAYFAHVGGFVAGAAIAVVMLKKKWVVMERYEKSLLQLLSRDSGQVEYSELTKALPHWQQEVIASESPMTETIEPETIKLEPQELEEHLIRFKCHCGQKIKVPGEYAGKIGKCPKCSARLNIPGG